MKSEDAPSVAQPVVKAFVNTRHRPPIHIVWACEYGRTSTVRFLLERGVKADSSFKRGETGLHWAAFGGHAEVVELLLKANAPEFKNSHYYKVIDQLVRGGAIVDLEWIDNPNRGLSPDAKLRGGHWALKNEPLR